MNISDVLQLPKDVDKDSFPFLPIFSMVGFDKAIENTVSHLLIALGSNYQADTYLPIAHEYIARMGTASFSSIFINPDYTATDCLPKPNYHNQCAIIKLTKPVQLNELVRYLKSIESDCHRQHHLHNTVSLDIDVLAIKILDNRLNDNFNNTQWQAIDKRYPFKYHEWVGIKALLDKIKA